MAQKKYIFLESRRDPRSWNGDNLVRRTKTRIKTDLKRSGSGEGNTSLEWHEKGGKPWTISQGIKGPLC